MIANSFYQKNGAIKRIAALCLALTFTLGLLCTSAVAVSQQELDALKNKQNQLAQQKAGIQTQSQALENEMNDKSMQLELLSQEIELTAQEMDTLTKIIAVYTNSVAEMEDTLVKCQAEEKRLMEQYRTRVRAMEENGSASYISIILKANSFTDLLSRVDCIMEISKHDNQLIDKVRQAQEQVALAKEAMEEEIAAQKLVFEEYEQKQAELFTQQTEVEIILSSLSASSADYKQQLEAINAMQNTLSGQISAMSNQLDELKRIEAEQRAAQNKPPTGTGTGGGTSNGNGNQWYSDGTNTATGMDIVNYSMGFLGVPYVYGGTSPSGFDCSGLVYYCYTNFGYSVNRTAASLAYNGSSVSKDNLQAGDVILFTSSGGGYIGHTGIYIGEGQFIHAPHTGDIVKISSLSTDYYTNHYYGARRII